MNGIALKGQTYVSPFTELVLDLHQHSLSSTGIFFFHELQPGVAQERNTQCSLQYLLCPSPPSDLRIFGFFRNLYSAAYLDLSELSYRKVQPQVWLLLNKEVGFLFILFPLPAFCYPQAV